MFFDDSEAIINPGSFVSKVDNMPDIGVCCFSKDLFLRIVKGTNATKIASLNSTDGTKEIYEIKYKNARIAFFIIGVGAPHAVNDLEEIHAMGVSKFIVFGNCGVLNENIKDCSIIIPTSAIREEGTSYHYLKDGQVVTLNDKYKDEFIEILNAFAYKYVEGKTWTTDAFYRETKNKLLKYQEEGAVCVEMEASALAVVANYRKLDLFIFFYAGDNLASPVWDKRSLDGLVKLDEKSEIAILALELANKIYEK